VTIVRDTTEEVFELEGLAEASIESMPPNDAGDSSPTGSFSFAEFSRRMENCRFESGVRRTAIRVVSPPRISAPRCLRNSSARIFSSNEIEARRAKNAAFARRITFQSN
jgi:hypothetical protein